MKFAKNFYFSGRFDGFPILNYIYKNNFKPQILARAQKIIEIKFSQFKLTMRDTYNFIGTRLANFPKSFQLEFGDKGALLM